MAEECSGTTQNGKIKNMVDKRILENCLFLDVETATGYRSFEDLETENPRLADLWSKRAKYYRTVYEDMNGLSDSEIYKEKATLEPEFSRVVCVSFGVLQESGQVRMTSFYGDDEEEILTKCAKVFNNAHVKGMKLAGHNIKGFDIPCLGKSIFIASCRGRSSFCNLISYTILFWWTSFNCACCTFRTVRCKAKYFI